MNPINQKSAQLAINASVSSAQSNGHRMGYTTHSGKLSNTTPSATKSPSGLYYLSCLDCGRVIFDNGMGSALSSRCDSFARSNREQ